PPLPDESGARDGRPQLPRLLAGRALPQARQRRAQAQRRPRERQRPGRRGRQGQRLGALTAPPADPPQLKRTPRTPGDRPGVLAFMPKRVDRGESGGARSRATSSFVQHLLPPPASSVPNGSPNPVPLLSQCSL